MGLCQHRLECSTFEVPVLDVRPSLLRPVPLPKQTKIDPSREINWPFPTPDLRHAHCYREVPKLGAVPLLCCSPQLIIKISDSSPQLSYREAQERAPPVSNMARAFAPWLLPYREKADGHKEPTPPARDLVAAAIARFRTPPDGPGGQLSILWPVMCADGVSAYLFVRGFRCYEGGLVQQMPLE